jgi:hypothetical protein
MKYTIVIVQLGLGIALLLSPYFQHIRTATVWVPTAVTATAYPLFDKGSAFAIPESKKEQTITNVVGNSRPIISANERAVAANILPHCEGCFVNVAANRVRDNPVSEELFGKAQRNGTVRVIVELQIPAGSDETREQRIREIQQRVLKELAGVSHALVRSFTAIPTLVLEASGAALQILARSKYVLRIKEDGLAAPLNNSAYSLPELLEMTALSRSKRS